MHTTNGNIGSTFQGEVNYLLSTTRATSHFIISKNGEIVQLMPVDLGAWHAGPVNDSHFDNGDSIGIEQHFTPGEDTNLPLMDEAAKRLIWSLMNQYPIYGITTHRAVAIDEHGNLGRKVDPSHQTDIQFRMWRDEVYAALIEKTIKTGAIIYTAPTKNSLIATHITDENILQGKIIKDYTIPVKHQMNGWVWISTGVGFVETKYLL